MRLTPLLAALALCACSPLPVSPDAPGGGGRDVALDPTDEPGAADREASWGASDLPVTPPASRPDEPGEEPDPPDEPSDETLWDPSPPAAVEGTRIHATMTCGLMTGPRELLWELAEGEWEGVQKDRPGAAGPRVELLPCFGPGGDKSLRWDADGALYFEAGGMGHDFWPSDAQDLWIGEVFTLADPSPACATALAEAGLSWPVTLTLTVDSIEVPEPA